MQIVAAHFQLSTLNLMEGRWWTALLYSFRHNHELHLGLNMLMLLATASGLLAALGPRRFLGLYAAAAVGGGLAELAVWDYLRPLLTGQQPHPSRDTMIDQVNRMHEARKEGRELPINEQ